MSINKSLSTRLYVRMYLKSPCNIENTFIRHPSAKRGVRSVYRCSSHAVVAVAGYRAFRVQEQGSC